MILTLQLTALGFPPDPLDDVDTLSNRYFNLRLRRVETARRKVHESKELSCPPELLNDYEALKEKFERGEDLLPHLSDRLGKDPDYYDQMLNDWGIYHFHFGPGRPSKVSGFSERTEKLVYAYLTPTDAYFIDVLPHEQWAEDKLLRIIHHNWPELIKSFHAPTILGLSHNPTPDERHLRRKNGMMSFIEIEPGVIYFSPGGGYMSDGTPLRAVQATQFYKRWVADMEAHLREQAQWYLDRIAEAGRGPDSPPRFTLQADLQAFFATERGSDMSFRLANHQL